MPYKFNRQRSIRKTVHLKWKNDTQTIQHTLHLETTLCLPCPDLRTNIVTHTNLTTTLLTEASLTELFRQAQIKSGVVHKTDMLRTILLNPIKRAIEQTLEKLVMLEHLHKANNRNSRQIIQQLRPGRLQLNTAQTSDLQVRLPTTQIGQEPAPHAHRQNARRQ